MKNIILLEIDGHQKKWILLADKMECDDPDGKFNIAHPEEEGKVITNLRNSSSFGLDFLDTYILKLVQPQILPALTHIINLSISTGKFPDSWKKSDKTKV